MNETAFKIMRTTSDHSSIDSVTRISDGVAGREWPLPTPMGSLKSRLALPENAELKGRLSEAETDEPIDGFSNYSDAFDFMIVS